jgi:hypothetical protein
MNQNSISSGKSLLTHCKSITFLIFCNKHKSRHVSLVAIWRHKVPGNPVGLGALKFPG